ncbi:MAG: chorismate lyase [Nitrosomonadales bacterium]|nr:chorismate lyase [Nitrosomonadales bacterium]
MSDPYWQNLTLDAGAYTSWLRDSGSLTQRIQQRCQQFSVVNIRSRLASTAYDESALLDVAARKQVYTREVFLLADEKPVVFAHSVVAAEDLKGAWQAVQRLGSRPLGALLFAHPLIRRTTLSHRALRPQHVLYRRAAVKLDVRPAQMWARRSIFTLHGAPLLVTEVFLPEILKLSK